MNAKNYKEVNRRRCIALLGTASLISGAGCLANEDDEETLETLEQADVVQTVRFDAVTNEAFVELQPDIPVGELLLESEKANEQRRLNDDDFGDVISLPVEHTGDTVVITAITPDGGSVVGEEEWTPTTPAAFENEQFDEANRVVQTVEVVDQGHGAAAEVTFADAIAADEVRIHSTVAGGEFETDTPESLDSANVQINVVHDEVTVAAVDGDETEVVHREHFQSE